MFGGFSFGKQHFSIPGEASGSNHRFRSFSAKLKKNSRFPAILTFGTLFVEEFLHNLGGNKHVGKQTWKKHEKTWKSQIIVGTVWPA